MDENDVLRVSQGQKVEVVVYATDRNRLAGACSSIAPVMGRRQY
jgi:multidrug resistance efflux pump